jgi:hypothetical protein
LEIDMGGHHHPPGPLGTASNADVGRGPGLAGYDPRHQAKALNAADARTLVKSALPAVLPQMTAAQLRQMQTVLDAAVVDPVVKAEADALYRRAVSYVGSLTVRDPVLVRRADRAMRHYVYVTEADKRIRLDYTKLLDPDALTPVTDNPDEAAYLARVKQTLANRGVWLRFAPKLVRDPEDPSHHVVDPRAFDVFLSLGPNGDTIPTKDGRLTRETLLGTTLFGAGYYTNVDRGAVQRALDREVRRLQIEIEAGWEQHIELARIRRDAPPLVAGISDLLGGADFPDESIWEGPRKLVLRAMQLNTGGNVKASRAFLMQAGLLTRQAGRLVAEYIDDTSAGAERAAKAAKVVKVAAQVTEAALTVYGAYGVLAAGEGALEVRAVRAVGQFERDNPEFAAELRQVRYVPQPKGTVLGGVKPGTSSGAGQGLLNKDPGF